MTTAPPARKKAKSVVDQRLPRSLLWVASVYAVSSVGLMIGNLKEFSGRGGGSSVNCLDQHLNETLLHHKFDNNVFPTSLYNWDI